MSFALHIAFVAKIHRRLLAKSFDNSENNGCQIAELRETPIVIIILSEPISASRK